MYALVGGVSNTVSTGLAAVNKRIDDVNTRIDDVRVDLQRVSPISALPLTGNTTALHDRARRRSSRPGGGEWKRGERPGRRAPGTRKAGGVPRALTSAERRSALISAGAPPRLKFAP